MYEENKCEAMPMPMEDAFVKTEIRKEITLQLIENGWIVKIKRSIEEIRRKQDELRDKRKPNYENEVETAYNALIKQQKREIDLESLPVAVTNILGSHRISKLKGLNLSEIRIFAEQLVKNRNRKPYWIEAGPESLAINEYDNVSYVFNSTEKLIEFLQKELKAFKFNSKWDV